MATPLGDAIRIRSSGETTSRRCDVSMAPTAADGGALLASEAEASVKVCHATCVASHAAIITGYPSVSLPTVMHKASRAAAMLTCDTVSPASRSRVYSAGRFPSRPMRAGGGRCPMASVPFSSTQSNHRPASPSSAADPPLLLSLLSLVSLRHERDSVAFGQSHQRVARCTYADEVDNRQEHYRGAGSRGPWNRART